MWAICTVILTLNLIFLNLDLQIMSMKSDSRFYVNIQHQTPIYVSKPGIVVRTIGVNIFLSLEKISLNIKPCRPIWNKDWISSEKQWIWKLEYIASYQDFGVGIYFG